MAHTSVHNPILDRAREQQAGAVPSSDLDLVEEVLAGSTGRIASSIAELTAGIQKTNVATGVIKESISDVTAANLIIAKTQDTANLQAQNATVDAFEAAGGTDAQTRLMRELGEDNDRVTAILEERSILANEDRGAPGLSLMDNIINQFNINLTNQQLKAATDKLKHTEQQITNTTGATESFARANSLTRKTLNEDSIAANYRAIEAEGRIKSAEAELSSLHSNANALTNVMRADARFKESILQAARLEDEAESRALQKERISFQREQMVFTREKWEKAGPAADVALEQARVSLANSKNLGPIRQLKAEQELASSLKRFNDQIAVEDQLVSSVQRGQSLAGVPIEDKGIILFNLRRPGDTGKKYARLQEIGGAIDPVLGFTAYEAKVSVDTIAPSGNIKPSKGLRLLAQISSLQADKYKQAGAKVPRDEATLQADYNVTAGEAAAIAAKDIGTNDQSNPYIAPPFTVLAQSSDLLLQPLYNKVLRPMTMRETNPQTILDASIAAIVEGVVTPDEAAAGIEAVFSLAALINNTQDGGFRRVGLPNQTTYNTKITRPPTFIEELKAGAAPRRLFEAFGAVPERTTEELFPNALISVDLMDRTRIQELIAKIMSGTRASIKDGDQINEQTGEKE